MIRAEEFESMSGEVLRIVTNRSNIKFVLPNDEVVGENNQRAFLFDEQTFKEFVNYLQQEGNFTWKNFNPKEATSFSSDYDEYYDKEYDNNGYLSVDGNRVVTVTACWNAENRLYQFSKAKLQSFVHDCLKRID